MTPWLNRWRSSLILILCLLPLLAVYTFRLYDAYSFDNDFGRDLVDIAAITRGDITLLGPKLSFGGLHTGPFYYYQFAPILFFFPAQPEALLLANAVFCWLALVLLGLVWIRQKNGSWWFVLAGLYWLGLSSYVLFSARGPGNAFSYVTWLILLLGLYPSVWHQRRWWRWGLYGLGWGIVINYHLVVLFVATPLLLALGGAAVIRPQRGRRLAGWLAAGSLMAGVILSFAPLVLFEFTHQFVMLRNTFIDQSYKAFTQNTNLINPLPTSTNPLLNGWLFVANAGSWVVPSLALLLLVLLVLALRQWRYLPRERRALLLALPAALILAALIARFQLAFHYFFPFIALAQVALLILLAAERWRLGLVAIAVGISIIFFPKQWFAPSARPIATFRAVSAQIAAAPLSQSLKTTPFAVYITRETPLAPLGFEYRYFLQTHGLVSVAPQQYAAAQQLLWIAEQPLADPQAVSSWELDQFGPRQLILTEQIGSRTVYLYAKRR